MASLRKHKGRYNARFYDKNRSPQRKEVSLGTSRKSVAEPKLRRMEEAYARGEYDPWNGGWLVENETLADAIERFLEVKERDGLQQSTLQTYEWKLVGLREHTPPGVMVRHVSPEHVRSYMNAPKKRDEGKTDVSNATKRSRYRHMQTFFTWAVDEGLADESPAADVRKPRKEEKKKAFLSPKDVEEVLRTIDAHRKIHDGEPGPTPEDEWLKEVIVIAVGTGLRRGELLNLRWRDVELRDEHLVVRNRTGFTSKNGKERVVPLAGDALNTLQVMFEARQPEPDEAVFLDADDNPPKPDRVSKRFKFYVREAKLQDREDLSFHSCRHTTASWLSMQGVPLRTIAEIMGHSSTSVTEIYSHLQPGVMKRAMQDTFGDS